METQKKKRFTTYYNKLQIKFIVMQFMFFKGKTLLNIPQMLKIFHLNKNGKEKDLVQTYQGI